MDNSTQDSPLPAASRSLAQSTSMDQLAKNQPDLSHSLQQVPSHNEQALETHAVNGPPNNNIVGPPAHEYLVKTMAWNDPGTRQERTVQIITQNENGPCPLICICNVLFIRGEMEIRPFGRPSVTFDYLVELLGDYLLTHAPTDAKAPDQNARDEPVLSSSPPEALDLASHAPQYPQPTTTACPPKKRHSTGEYVLTYRHNLDSALTLLPRLQSGLDMNVQFTSIRDFEPTAELALFDLFKVDLVHGWMVDPQDEETHRVVVEQCKSYNGVVECIVHGNEVTDGSSSSDEGKEKQSVDSAVHDGLVASTFLEDTATQLTYYGIDLLTDTLPKGSLVVLFRNNHFSTLYKHSETDRLFILVTDSGLVSEADIVWETLGDVDQGTSEFVDSHFLPPGTNQSEPNHANLSDLDYALAISMQEEEHRQHRQDQQQRQQPQQPQSGPPQQRIASTPGIKKKSSCLIS
ncbi:DUF544-domain-containing protein [Hesseltinella vesiculosa]|uniref:DUF544-domain-containing protein n=1 Tax=Hesseltinella vesiculosa TaxID=101127 RepID=A0A1X2GFR4_9FUNG|nr:DUF544-domain-containing protein [Hesseltinella vesiculosa]